MIGIIRGLNTILMLASAFFLVGCAFGTRHPTLIYPPTEELSGLSVVYASVSLPPKGVQILLKPFIDSRSNTKVVGTVRNGFGMKTADVIPKNNVSDWVTRAISTELQNNGYTVINKINARNLTNSNAVVSVEILNVYCDMFISYMGQVSLVTRVNKNGKEIINKHYLGEGSSGLSVAATEESYAQSLALALSSAINKFVSDLDNHFTVE